MVLSRTHFECFLIPFYYFKLTLTPILMFSTFNRSAVCYFLLASDFLSDLTVPTYNVKKSIQ